MLLPSIALKFRSRRVGIYFNCTSEVWGPLSFVASTEGSFSSLKKPLGESVVESARREAFLHRKSIPRSFGTTQILRNESLCARQ